MMREKASNAGSVAQWVCDSLLEALLPMVESSRQFSLTAGCFAGQAYTQIQKNGLLLFSYPARYGDDSKKRGNPGNGLLLDAAKNAYVPVA
jgi:hypothetical protein